MMRTAVALTLLALLAACGVEGPPVAPAGAVSAVAVEGSNLTPEKGSI